MSMVRKTPGHSFATVVKKKSSINKLDAMYFVLLPEDTPQFRTLPDLGWLVRGCLIAHHPPALPRLSELIVQVLLLFSLFDESTLDSARCQACLPYSKTHTMSSSANMTTTMMMESDMDAATCWILLNLLLGTLLGLYPSNVKRPPFPARVWLYTRVHMILTSPRADQSTFILTHMGLFQVAVAEYLCHVVPMFFTPEFDALVSALPPLLLFFHQGGVLVDAFRQEAIDKGDESWEDMCAHADSTYERISRIYKAKCRSTPTPRHFLQHSKKQILQCRRHVKVPGDITKEEMRTAMGTPVIRRYPFHDHIQNALPSEYRTLTNTDYRMSFIHSIVDVTLLSLETRNAQEHKVAEMEGRCAYLAQMRRTMLLCLFCERAKAKKNMCICNRTERAICKEHGSGCVVEINMLGKIVRVHGTQYIFTMCCGTIQEYAADGSELMHSNYDEANADEDFSHRRCCSHVRQAQQHHPPKSHPKIRPECDYCHGTALQMKHVVLDMATADLTSVCLCQKHTPPAEWTRNCVTRRQFDLTVNAWVERWKPRPELNTRRERK
jgi:hypothetical protein